MAVCIASVKMFLGELEKSGVNYFVSGGLGLDGLRGHVSRKHKDIDVWVFAEQLPALFETLKKKGYELFRKLNKFEIQNKGLVADVLPLTKRLKQRVIYGNSADSYFPSKLFSKFRKGKIGAFKFRVVPNEVFALEMQYSGYPGDKEMAESLDIDNSLFSRIKYFPKKAGKIELETI